MTTTTQQKAPPEPSAQEWHDKGYQDAVNGRFDMNCFNQPQYVAGHRKGYRAEQVARGRWVAPKSELPETLHFLGCTDGVETMWRLPIP